MAITINVGGSKKVSQNYDSQGVSLNVTAEVPNDALGEPQKIADTAQDLFDLVHGLLDEQIAKLNGDDSGNGSRYRRRGRDRYRERSGSNGRGHYRGTGQSSAGNGNGRGGNPDRPLTQAQRKAIGAMVARLDEDGDTWVRHEFGVDRVSDLTVRQASQFIDILKGAIDDQQPEGARR